MGKIEQKMLAKFLIDKDVMLSKFSQYISINNLNYDIDELERIENKAFNLLCNDEFAELYSLYIGEIIIKYTAGRWEIDNLKKDLAYHKPVVLRPERNKMRLCPMVDWFGLLKKGRLKEGISGMVKKVIEYENKN